MLHGQIITFATAAIIIAVSRARRALPPREIPPLPPARPYTELPPSPRPEPLGLPPVRGADE